MGKGRVGFKFPGTSTIAYGSITGSYIVRYNADTLGGNFAVLTITNTLNQPVQISLDGGSLTTFHLLTAQGITIDFGANGMAYSGKIAVKHSGVAPTSGSIVFGGLQFKN